jgi:hypothetical protein
MFGSVSIVIESHLEIKEVEAKTKNNARILFRQIFCGTLICPTFLRHIQAEREIRAAIRAAVSGAPKRRIGGNNKNKTIGPLSQSEVIVKACVY